jgi:hypothetical protein
MKLGIVLYSFAALISLLWITLTQANYDLCTSGLADDSKCTEITVTHNLAWFVLIVSLVVIIGCIIGLQRRHRFQNIFPGWYTDPWGVATVRWHNGQHWTEHTRNN